MLIYVNRGFRQAETLQRQNMWKSSVSVAALVCYAGALNAEDTFFDTHLPGIVENIARGAEQGDALGAAEQELTGWTLNFLNSAVD